MTLTLYILTHNRPADALRAVESAIAQTSQDFQLVVSDNSTDDRLKHLMLQQFPQVAYVRREPTLSALEHFNRCLDEVRTSHVCLFHDDDLLAPEFVGEVLRCIARHPDAIAIGCNAWVESMGAIQQRPSFLAAREDDVIESPRALALRYFGRHQSGTAPFPGYVYKHSALGAARFVPDGGKYSDVAWLLRIALLGDIIWIARPLMTYRLHGGNDGAIESRRDRMRLLAFLKRHVDAVGKTVIDDYRCAYVYKPIRRLNSAGKKGLTADRFLRRHQVLRAFRPATYAALLKRGYLKWRA